MKALLQQLKQHSGGIIWLFKHAFDKTTSLLYKKGHFNSVFTAHFYLNLSRNPILDTLQV